MSLGEYLKDISLNKNEFVIESLQSQNRYLLCTALVLSIIFGVVLLVEKKSKKKRKVMK
ncbi:hypothetical protein [Priestia flexa]|uniref:hypothetical protein n=1 Tax=Priestia flexa TaxID=86664 RepID=UPI0012948210|nr:hypothetical protein [Priestia flexa]